MSECLENEEGPLSTPCLIGLELAVEKMEPTTAFHLFLFLKVVQGMTVLENHKVYDRDV